MAESVAESKLQCIIDSWLSCLGCVCVCVIQKVCTSKGKNIMNLMSVTVCVMVKKKSLKGHAILHTVLVTG